MLPNAVRSYEIEQPTLLDRGSRIKKSMGLACQGEQSDTFIHVSVTSLQMARHIPLTAIKLVSPLRRYSTIKLVGDSSIQLVDVNSFQTAPQPIYLGP